MSPCACAASARRKCKAADVGPLDPRIEERLGLLGRARQIALELLEEHPVEVKQGLVRPQAQGLVEVPQRALEIAEAGHAQMRRLSVEGRRPLRGAALVLEPLDAEGPRRLPLVVSARVGGGELGAALEGHHELWEAIVGPGHALEGAEDPVAGGRGADRGPEDAEGALGVAGALPRLRHLEAEEGREHRVVRELAALRDHLDRFVEASGAEQLQLPP
jgi:hypothetical protein